jgi:hypothetical protein
MKGSSEFWPGPICLGHSTGDLMLEWITRLTIKSTFSALRRFRQALVIISLFPVHSVATTIVLVRTPHEIIIAADSKGIAFLALGDQVSLKETPVCKINGNGNFFYAMSGYVRSGEPSTASYNMYAVAERLAFKEKGMLRDKVNRFEQAIRHSLRLELTRLRNNHRSIYDTYVKRPHISEAVFFAFEKGGPEVYYLKFAGVQNKPRSGLAKLKVTRRFCGKGCQEPLFIARLGEQVAIDRLLATQPNYWKGELVRKVQELIEIEIKEAPSVVGPPTDLLHLDKQGTHWLQRKELCKTEEEKLKEPK